MSNKSIYAANQMLDKQFGGANYTPAPTVYVALMTAAPTSAGGGTEVAGGSYARAAVTNDLTNFPAPVNGQLSNGALIQFAQASANRGTIVAADANRRARRGDKYPRSRRQ